MSNYSEDRLVIPADFQAAMVAEASRVEANLLAPRGLDARTVLIVGGAGYVGCIVTRHLLEAGYRVRVLDSILYNHSLVVLPFLGEPGYQFINGDLTDPAALDTALDGVTDVVLLAGLVGDPITKKYPALSGRINDDGYDLILKNLDGRGLNKVVFVSTCSNYGLIPDNSLADEDFALNPLSLYAKSKVRVEKALLGCAGTVDYTATVLRFATAFGLSPRMRFDLTVSEFTRALVRGEDLLVYDAHTWRPYCHLRDFARLIDRVLTAPQNAVAFDVFNAGGEVNNYTKQMIVDQILKQVPDSKVRYQEHGQDPRNYRVDFTKVRERLHFEPRFTVADGIAELVAALKSGLFDDISVPTSFYGNWDIKGAA